MASIAANPGEGERLIQLLIESLQPDRLEQPSYLFGRFSANAQAQPLPASRAVPDALRFRPGLIVAKRPSLALALARRMRPRSKLLFWLDRAPKPSHLSRIILAQADCICTPDPVTLIRDFGFLAGRIVTMSGAADFHRSAGLLAPSRQGDEAYRIAYAGPLIPQAGVYDFQAAAASWADANPDRILDLCWIGEGDLKGILAAQPLPSNLRQSFAALPHGFPTAAALAPIFAQCGLLAVPTLGGESCAALRAGMAAGLPVIASTRDRGARVLVRPGESGWLFDPLRPGAMRGALEAALSSSPELLDVMRKAASESIERLEQPALAAWINRVVGASALERIPGAASPVGAG